ncbi:hypothetical protein C5L14_12765 [Labrys okinawensis]|uniref:DUF559 domain-containing protein n=1 Tax=Labrys okinawensis TaxID=346911 RepID=A0A2S9QDP7_9HYPH|nr:DUF559 domain-containing protein [Labrys okinawensis]PRH87478.1 hypothetical protein C5L14_12765 [Labrys okinawensis]
MSRKTISDFRRTTAQRLRADTTEAERKLWRALERLPLEGTHFRRQAPLGSYVVDFLCPAAKLVIELDGEQHGREEIKARDDIRTRWLNSQGYNVVRFWNHEIFDNLEGVLDTLYAALYGELNTPATRFRHIRYVKARPADHPTPTLRVDPPPPGEGEAQ